MLNFIKNKCLVRVLFSLSTIIDIVIGYFLNKISDDSFHLFSTYNVIILSVFVILVIIYVLIEVLIYNPSRKAQRKRLLKAFGDNGGYDIAVKEICKCVQEHDFKSIRRIKKVIEYIEK